MKRIISLIFLLLSFSGAACFAQADSIKVRLQTSNGAEISLDGDLSSTNIIIKKIPIGKHEVIVKYGFDYSKTYEIDVEIGGKTDFEFLVEGKLELSSTPPNFDVLIDGLPMGKTPLDVNILGRHNIQVLGNAEKYFPYNTTIEILPEQVVEHQAVISKRPPKLYGFVIFNYILSAQAPGLMVAIGRRIGGYLKMNYGINELYAQNLDTHYSIDPGEYRKQPKYIGCNAGLTYRIHPNMFIYAGSGYGSYSHGTYEEGYGELYNVYNAEGMELDLGCMFKYKALLLQVGYTRILPEGEGGSFGDLTLGIGFTIHKNKKR